MAQQHLDPTDPTARAVTGDALADYLRAQATEFLRALRLHREAGAGGGGAPGRANARLGDNGSEESVDAVRALRRSARRISASLHTFRPLLDPDWSEAIRPELAWLSGTLGMEHAYAARLERLLLALHRLSGATTFPTQPAAAGGGPFGTAGTSRGAGSAGGSRAGAGAAGSGRGAGAGGSRGNNSANGAAADGSTDSADAAADGRSTGTFGAAASGRSAGAAHAAADGRSTDPFSTTADGRPPNAPGAAPSSGSVGAAAGTPAAATASVPRKAAPAGSGHSTHPTATAADAAATADVAAGGRTARTAPVPLKAAPGSAGPATRPAATPDRGNLTVGAAKAGALLERQLTLARTRAHSTALQALGSSRFHAVADTIAVLASEVPLTPAAAGTDLHPLAAAAEERLTDAVAALPLITAGHPYNAEALIHGLSPDPSPHPQDAPWHQVRLLLRLHRYAREALYGDDQPVDVRLLAAGQALNRHRDASEAAAAAAQAARTPRIAPATAYALGVLHADQRHEVEAARFAFQQCWQKQTVGTP